MFGWLFVGLGVRVGDLGSGGRVGLGKLGFRKVGVWGWLVVWLVTWLFG